MYWIASQLIFSSISGPIIKVVVKDAYWTNIVESVQIFEHLNKLPLTKRQGMTVTVLNRRDRFCKTPEKTECLLPKIWLIWELFKSFNFQTCTRFVCLCAC